MITYVDIMTLYKCLFYSILKINESITEHPDMTPAVKLNVNGKRWTFNINL